MRHAAIWAVGLSLGASVAATSTRALACGGCFSPPQPSGRESVVTDHRMAIAIHANESVLWDQVRYSGDPSEFSWVLPVSGDVRIELASEGFFDRLDPNTAPVWYAPQVQGCPSRGFAFASSGGAAADAAANADSGVQVLSQSVVGPYETVVLRSSDNVALTDWLTQHGYTIPASIQPVIASYVALHMDFAAMRLQPGEGVQAMQPIRIRYPSATTVFPLRMVAAGVGDNVGITLWVFGTGRYDAMNFGNATIDPNELVWDWDTNTANYDSVFAATLARTMNGRAWITEYAQASTALASNFGSYVNYDAAADDGGSASTPTDDWVLATENNAPGSWVTRLRTSLPVADLDQDLQVGATASDAVSNVFNITHESGERPQTRCAGETTLSGGGGNGVSCRATPDGSAPGERLVELGGLAAALAAIVRRVRRPAKRR